MINHKRSIKSPPLYRSRLCSTFVLSFVAGFLLYCTLGRAAQESGQDQAANNETTSVAEVNQADAFKSAIQEMAIALFANLADPDPGGGDLADGIVVSSFVDLKKLTRTSSFGRYLAEQLMTEFQQQGYRVVEFRKSTSIRIQEQRGEYGLSREVAEINPTVRAGTMITGTYTMAGNHILVNAKVLDNKSAALLSSATMVFPRTILVDQLLADSVSASPRKREVTVLKRLEL
jgi:TolB-like protein